MPRIMVNEFTGGLTDSPYTSPENCAEVIDNLLLKKDGTLEGVGGIAIYSNSASRLPTNKRVARWARLSPTELVAFSDSKAFYVTPSAVTEILGPTGNRAFNVGDEDSAVSVALFNNTIHATSDARPYQIKIYIDENGDPQLRTAGLPIVASDPTITPSGVGTNNYIYAFVHIYEYRVGNTLFVDFGTPRYVTKTALNNNNTISAIPVLSNGADYNWDTTVIKIGIYRTVTNGVAFYKVGEVTNGTTGFVDTVTDANLVLNETLYTNGGISNNDIPDPCKYIFEANDTYYNLDILQDTEEKPFRLKQSITNDPDSIPDDYINDFKANLRGGGVVGRSPIILTETQTIRLDGIIDETGKGFIQKEILSNTVGGISHNGVVQTSKGLYFPSKDGFYYTDGFSTPTKLAKKNAFTSKIDIFYKEFVSTNEQQSRIQGVYDSLNNRVIWSVQESEADNDKFYVYDETHDAFTTLSNNSGILPTAIIMDGEDLIIGDGNGYIFRLSKDFFTHPKVDTSLPVTDWVEDTIIYRWKSVHLTGGDASINKWFTKVNVQGIPETNVNMAILSYTNGEMESKELYPVRVAPSLVWGDPSFEWGDDAFVWNRQSTLNQTRRFPAGRLRARQRQIEFTNAYYTILSSTDDTDSYITINASMGLAILVTPSSYIFGANNEGYDLIIGSNSYPISSGTADTLTLIDADSTLVDGTYAWSIKGYGKGQRPQILNFSAEFEPMDDAGTKWHGSPTK
jgi:hypothetical protein